MKLIYIGGWPSGSVKDPRTGTDCEFKRGEPIELPEALAKELLARGDWETAGAKKKASEQ